MSIISKEMVQNIESGSMIRKMFETGAQLRAIHGDKVCDFSLGNPDLAPPACVATALRELADKVSTPASLGYMLNSGFEFARQSLANYLSEEQHIVLAPSDVILTCGAAGGIQVFFKTVLDPQDEVLGISPYFVEYNKYIACNGGVFKAIAAKEDFSPDFDALEQAISEKTRAIMINSPNNPTGVIYSEDDVKGLIALVEKASAKFGRMIYLVSDEPYRFLAYDSEVPSLLDKSKHCVVFGSFSKNLALAGERIGYIALSPLFDERSLLMAGLTQANRFLGFVNAPIVGQYLMDAALNSPDIKQNLDNAKAIYRKRRDMFAKILTDAGINFIMPQGAFYFFPQSPIADEQIFVDALKEELILAVPGRGFGRAGHFRLSFAVPDAVIANSAEGFKKAVAKVK